MIVEKALQLLKSDAWRAMAPRERVESYFDAIGIGGTESEVEHRVKETERRFPAEWSAVVEVIEQRAAGVFEDDFYNTKNARAEVSLAFTALYVREVLRQLLIHVSPREVPESILDMGCENGVATCYFGLLYPAASIVGSDPSKKAVDVGRRLAEALQLGNTVFVCEDADSFPLHADRKFDVIVASTVFQDSGYFPVEEDLS